jgi:hypothetical protein
MCSAPAAPNAVTPSVYVGQSTYTWTCQAGFVGSPVSRTCNSNDGSWSGSPIVCISCNAPSAPTDGWVRQLDASNWQYGCNPGTFTPSGISLPTTRSCTVNGFTGSGFTCQSCGMGYYCPVSEFFAKGGVFCASRDSIFHLSDLLSVAGRRQALSVPCGSLGVTFRPSPVVVSL